MKRRRRFAFRSPTKHDLHLSLAVCGHKWHLAVARGLFPLLWHIVPSQGRAMSWCVVFARRASVVSDDSGRCAFVLSGVPGGSAFASISARGSMASLYGRHTLLNWFIM